MDRQSLQNFEQQLLQILKDSFSEEDLKSLCFALNIDYDSLPAQGKQNKARELLVYIRNRKRTAELMSVIKQQRPDVDLPEVTSYQPEPVSNGSSVVSPLPPQRWIIWAAGLLLLIALVVVVLILLRPDPKRVAGSLTAPVATLPGATIGSSTVDSSSPLTSSISTSTATLTHPITIKGFNISRGEETVFREPNETIAAQAGEIIEIEVLLDHPTKDLTFVWTTEKEPGLEPITFKGNPNLLYTTPQKAGSGLERDTVTVEIYADGTVLERQSIVVSIQ